MSISRQISADQSITINKTLSISGSEISNQQYLAHGEFGEIYSAKYIGDDQFFQQNYCTDIHGQYFFVIKYDKTNSPEFKLEQATVTDIANSKTNKSHMSLSTGAQISDATNNTQSEIIISPFEYQKFSKNNNILSRDAAKFAWVKKDLNQNKKPKLAHDQGTLLLGLFWDMHTGLLQCHQAGYLHLDNAPRNFLMGATEYDENGKALAYHARISDYGQSRKMVNGNVDDSSTKMPILISSANRLHGGTLTIADDLYAFRMAMLEEILLLVGGNLKSAFRGLLKKNGYTSFDFKDIAQCIYDINDDNKVLNAIFERTLEIVKQPQGSNETPRDRTDLVSLLESLKGYICSANCDDDKSLQQLHFDLFVSQTVSSLSKKFRDAYNNHDAEKINEVTLSLKRLAKLPSAYQQDLNIINNDSKKIQDVFSALDESIFKDSNPVEILPVNPAILAAAQNQDTETIKNNLHETIKFSNDEIKNLSVSTNDNKKTKLSRFLKMLSHYENVKKAHEELGIAIPHNIYVEDVGKESKALATIYKAYKNIANGVINIDFTKAVSKSDQNTAVFNFIAELNKLIELHSNEWTPATKDTAITHELVDAYKKLDSYGIKLTPEMIVEFAINNPDKVIHPKILKHLNHMDKLSKTLANPHTKKLNFYQRHPILSWAIIGGATTLGLIGIGIAIVVTHGGATPLLIPFAHGVTALASTVGISTASASPTLLGSIGLSSATAAVTGFFSGLSAGISAGVRKIVQLFKKSVTVAVPATDNTTKNTKEEPEELVSPPTPQFSRSSSTASITYDFMPPNPNTTGTPGYSDRPATSTPMDVPGYGNGVMESKSSVNSSYSNLGGSRPQYIEAPNPKNNSGYGTPLPLFLPKRPTNNSSGYDGLPTSERPKSL